MKYSELPELTKWLLLATRVGVDDSAWMKADTAYLVGETKHNAPSVLRKGAELWKKGIVPTVAIQKGGEGFGYYGYQNSLNALQRLGVPSRYIVPMPILSEFEAARQVNTLTELLSLARLAKQNGWQGILLIPPHFHQLRSFLTAVTAVEVEYLKLKIFNCAGAYLPWDEQVIHSQGTLIGVRWELFVKEVERIKKYQNAPATYPLVPLVSVERALEYLDQRDA